ncbi:MAG: hypothetical protein HY204_09560 [Nitrospirae bacterium]|nr:hypothetical protein [Nitrospirota bacterium]
MCTTVRGEIYESEATDWAESQSPIGWMLKSQGICMELSAIHLGFLVTRAARFEVEDGVGTVVESGNDVEAAVDVAGALAARELEGLGAHVLFAVTDDARRRTRANRFGPLVRIELFL